MSKTFRAIVNETRKPNAKPSQVHRSEKERQGRKSKHKGQLWKEVFG